MGVFPKNKRGYIPKAKNYRFLSLLILLLSVVSIRRKLLKTTYGEERSVHKIQKVVIYDSGRKKNQFNKSDITTCSHRLSFDAFV